MICDRIFCVTLYADDVQYVMMQDQTLMAMTILVVSESDPDRSFYQLQGLVSDI